MTLERWVTFLGWLATIEPSPLSRKSTSSRAEQAVQQYMLCTRSACDVRVDVMQLVSVVGQCVCAGLASVAGAV